MKTQMSKPLAVVIGDIHYSPANLELADAALAMAIAEAQRLEVPVIINGDLHDTKDILRGKCMNRITARIESATTPVYIMVGNHDLLNERSNEEHALGFLKHCALIIDAPYYDEELGLYLVPYQPDKRWIEQYAAQTPDGATWIMHQGVMGAHMGEYVVDKTSCPPETFSRFRVFSGHYHRHQTVGTVTFIGSPYTITATEASDGFKGFMVLNEDKSYELVSCGLRKHVTVERTCDTVLAPIVGLNPEDKLWIKVTGPTSKLDKLSKKLIGETHLSHQRYKLERIYDKVTVDKQLPTNFTPSQIIDSLIDSSNEDTAYKEQVKKHWRELINEAA